MVRKLFHKALPLALGLTLSASPLGREPRAPPVRKLPAPVRTVPKLSKSRPKIPEVPFERRVSLTVFGKRRIARTKGEFKKIIDATAAEAEGKTGVSSALIKAVVRKESGFNATSRAGIFKGAGQLGPAALREVRNAYGYRLRNPYDLGENLSAAGFYLRFFLEKRAPFVMPGASPQEKVRAAISAYQLGPYHRSLRNFPSRGPINRSYVKSVWKDYSAYSNGKDHAWVARFGKRHLHRN